MGYSVTDLITHLNGPYNQEHNKAYTPALLGTEVVALRMTYANHDWLFPKTKGAVGDRHGLFVGEPELIVGKYGRSYRLNGVDSAIQVAYVSALNIADAFAVSLWVRPRVRPDATAPVVMRGTAGAFKLEVEPTVTGHRFKASIKTSDLVTTSVYTEEADFQVNRWTNIQLVYSGSTWKVFQDLIEVDSAAKAGTPFSSSDPISIGTDGDVAFYEMDVKDFRLISGTVTADHRTTVHGSEHKRADGEDANNAKYIQAWHTAFWEKFAADYDFVHRQLYVPTAEGPFLDLHGRPTRTVREPDESDISYRTAIIADRRRLLGNVSIEDIIEVVGTIVGDVGTGNIQVTENIRPDGSYEPAYLSITVSSLFLLSRGFTAGEIPGLLADLEERIGRGVAAGVRVEFVIQTGAEWNNGQNWNNGELYGA